MLEVCPDPEVVDRVASAIGLATASYQVQELFWGIRRFLAHLAAEAPIVVVLDDIHWAEATFLQLIVHLTTSSPDAPILLLCGTRTALLERDPTWATGTLDRRIDLAPIERCGCGAVAESLLGATTLDPEVRARHRGRSGGQPALHRAAALDAPR